MRRSWLTRLLVALAIVGMPMQGMAETLSAVFCVPHMHRLTDAPDHDCAPRHQPSEHSHDGTQSDTSDHGGATQGALDHACCPIVASGLPPSAGHIAMPTFIALALAPEFSHYYVFLKRPQRPPLA